MKRIVLLTAALLMPSPQARSDRPPLQEQTLPPPGFQAPPIQAAPQWQQAQPRVVNPPPPAQYPPAQYPPTQYPPAQYPLAPGLVGQPMVLPAPSGQGQHAPNQPPAYGQGQPRVLNPPSDQGQYPPGQARILNPLPDQGPAPQPQSAQGQSEPGQYPPNGYPPLQFPAAQSPMTQAPVTQAPVTQAPLAQAPATQAPVAPTPPAAAGQDQAAAPPAVIPPAAQWPNQWVPASAVRLQALDKVNAQAASLTVKVGQPATFGSLTITVKSCAVRPPDQPADAAAYLDVTDSHPDQPGFAGWMLANEPSVSMMQNPIYDLRVTGCG